MTPKQLRAVGSAFAVFLRMFEVCIGSQPTVAHLHSYCRGLLSDLPRTTAIVTAKRRFPTTSL